MDKKIISMFSIIVFASTTFSGCSEKTPISSAPAQNETLSEAEELSIFLKEDVETIEDMMDRLKKMGLETMPKKAVLKTLAKTHHQLIVQKAILNQLNLDLKNKNSIKKDLKEKQNDLQSGLPQVFLGTSMLLAMTLAVETGMGMDLLLKPRFNSLLKRYKRQITHEMIQSLRNVNFHDIYQLAVDQGRASRVPVPAIPGGMAEDMVKIRKSYQKTLETATRRMKRLLSGMYYQGEAADLAKSRLQRLMKGRLGKTFYAATLDPADEQAARRIYRKHFYSFRAGTKSHKLSYILGVGAAGFLYIAVELYPNEEIKEVKVSLSLLQEDLNALELGLKEAEKNWKSSASFAYLIRHMRQDISLDEINAKLDDALVDQSSEANSPVNSDLEELENELNLGVK